MMIVRGIGPGRRFDARRTNLKLFEGNVLVWNCHSGKYCMIGSDITPTLVEDCIMVSWVVGNLSSQVLFDS